jgi:predicted transcriptional regulator
LSATAEYEIDQTERGAAMATVSVRLPDEQDQRIRALAVARDISVSAAIRDAVALYIEKQRAERVSLLRRGRDGERRWRLFDLLTR